MAEPGTVSWAGRLQAALTFGAWALLTLHLLTYLVNHGANLPYQDEWWFTPQVVGDSPVAPWLFERHNEHLYPLGKFVYWAATRAAGDFRAAALLSIALLSGASLALVNAARHVRGGSHAADVLFPALLLNWGHFENLLIAYQVVLILPLAAQAAVIRALTRLPSAPLGRTATAVGLLLLVVLQGGGFGLAAVPPLVAWLFAASATLASRGERGAALRVAALAALSATVAVAVIGAVARNPDVAPAPDWGGKSLVALQYLGVGLGPDTALRGRPVPLAGVFVLSGHALALGLLAVAARRPGEFFRATGLGGLLVANLTVAAGLGATREFGYAPRYAAPAALGVAVVLVTLVIYGPRGSRRASVAVGFLAVAGAIALVADQVGLARHVGPQRRFQSRQLLAEARDGATAEYLASAHEDFLLFPGRPLAPQIVPLMRGRFGPFRNARPDDAAPEYAVPAEAVLPAWSDGQPLSVVVWSGSARKLQGVRVEFLLPASVPYLHLTLRWGEKSASVYRLRGELRQEVVFWVNDQVSELRLEQTSPGPGLHVTGVWLRGTP